MSRKDIIVKGAISLFMLGIVIVATLFIVNYDKSDNKKAPVDLKLDLKSSLVSKDPRISAANFLKANGTIGDVSKVNKEFFGQKVIETNAERRINAFKKVKDAIVPDSPIITGREIENAKTQSQDFPIFYTIDKIKVGEPSEVKPLVIEHDGIGSTEYDSVEVLADFVSYQDTFYWPTDVTGDSIITQERAKDEFKDVKITLVKSGELWFIYDVEDIEYNLNVRMATWSGRGKDDVSPNQEKVAEYEFNYE